MQTVAASGSTLAVVLNPGLTYEDRIDALEGDVARFIVPTYAFDPADPALAYNPWVFIAEKRRAPRSSRPGPARLDWWYRISRPGCPCLARRQEVHIQGATDSAFRTAVQRLRHGGCRALLDRASVVLEARPDVPGIHFLADVVGGQFNHGDTRHVRGIRVAGDTITFTLAKPSASFLERLALPFFCIVPVTTPLVEGGLTLNAPPSAGPYYMSDGFNGEYAILKRNPNYSGPRRARSTRSPSARESRPSRPLRA